MSKNNNPTDTLINYYGSMPSEVTLHLFPVDVYYFVCFLYGRLQTADSEESNIIHENLNRLTPLLKDEYREDFLKVKAQFSPENVEAMKKFMAENPNFSITDIIK